MSHLDPTSQSYAPTSTTSYTISDDSSKYQREITKSSLIKSPLHKIVYETLAEVYSIITALEVLESSYLKDYITDKEKYTSTASRLISQYRMLTQSLRSDSSQMELLSTTLQDTLDPELGNFLSLFTLKFNLDTPLAIKRLTSGVPATIENLNSRGSLDNSPSSSSTSVNRTTTTKNVRLIAEITGNFITCMDAVKLNYRTKDQLHPLLSDLVISLNDLSTSQEISGNDGKSAEFVGKSKLVTWLIKLNSLQDHKEITQEETDSFLNDLDNAYKNFYVSLD